MQSDYRLTLDVNSVQARIIERALDFFLRVGIGQLEVVEEVLDRQFPDKFKNRDLVKDLLKVIKSHSLLPGVAGNYGIGHKDVHDDVKVAYDLNKTLQKAIALSEDHDRWITWHDGNIVKYGPQPLAHVKETS